MYIDIHIYIYIYTHKHLQPPAPEALAGVRQDVLKRRAEARYAGRDHVPPIYPPYIPHIPHIPPWGYMGCIAIDLKRRTEARRTLHTRVGVEEDVAHLIITITYDATCDNTSTSTSTNTTNHHNDTNVDNHTNNNKTSSANIIQYPFVI